MELRQEGSSGTPSDHGDSPATATPIAVGESIEGDLSVGDSDYFRVTMRSAGMLMASTTGSTNTYGSIEDSSGNILNENDDGGADGNFYVSVAVSPGTYYIRVRSFDASSTGAYTLKLEMEESFGWQRWSLGRRGRTSPDPPPGWRLFSFLVTGWPLHRLRVHPRRQRGGLRNGSDGSNPRRLTHHSGRRQVSFLVTGWSPHRLLIRPRRRR